MDRKWSYLLYLAGDNSLSSEMDQYINEVVETGSSDQVGAAAQIDERGPNNTYRYVIGTPGQSERQHIPEVDSGSGKALTDFIVWGIQQCPAEKYAVIVADHGGGTSGIAIDETSGDDEISLADLKLALQQARAKVSVERIALFGMDACVMAFLEVFYELKDQAKCLVGSEEIEMEYAWPQGRILQALKDNPSMQAEDLGDVIATQGIKHGDCLTLSSVLSSKLAPFTVEVVNFVAEKLSALLAQGDTGKAVFGAVQAAISGALQFQAGGKDFFDFVQELQTHATGNVRSLLDPIFTQVKNNEAINPVIANHYQPSDDRPEWAKYASATGMAITLPDLAFSVKYNLEQGYAPSFEAAKAGILKNCRDDLKSYRELDFGGASSWSTFLAAYYDAFSQYYTEPE